jgi:hypothetical protein
VVTVPRLADMALLAVDTGLEVATAHLGEDTVPVVDSAVALRLLDGTAEGAVAMVLVPWALDLEARLLLVMLLIRTTALRAARHLSIGDRRLYKINSLPEALRQRTTLPLVRL